MRRIAAVGLFVLLLPGGLMAQDQRAMLELVVNGATTREVLVVLRGTDALVAVVALTEGGLEMFDGRREDIDGETYVSLASLAPTVSFAVDERDLRLVVNANPELLAANVRDFRIGPPAGLVYRRNTSGFVNYSLNVMDGERYDAFTESAVSIRGALLYNTLSATGRTATRGVTSVTFDDRRHMRRWVLGDSFSHTGPLGGDAWVAGVNISREFAIDPYFIRQPSLSVTTPVSVPSVMEVYVNGRMVSQEPVAPGLLDVRNIPVTNGRNDAQVVVRDPFGGVRELSTNYYLTSSALAPGLHDYQYSIGFRRQSLGVASWDYSSPVALARHRIGLSSSVTAGGRLEVASHLVSGGPSLNLRLPFGEVETATALSRANGLWGVASVGSYAYSRRPLSAGGSLMVASEQYTTVSPRAAADRPAAEGAVFGGMSLFGRASLTLQHGGARLHGGAARSRTGLLVSAQLSRMATVTVSAAQTRGEQGRSRELFAGLTILFGRANTTLATVRDAQGTRAIVDAHQPLPVGSGYGYQLHAETGPASTFGGVGRYQNRYGRYEVRHDRLADQSHTTLSAMGAIVGIGGGLYASRPVQAGFAVVRVPGVEGVRGFASHQEIGRTNRGGNLLVPDLQPYYGNLLSISDSDVPLDYSIQNTGLTLAVPYRGGALAVFPVRRVRQVVGMVRVVRGGQEYTPEYGEISVAVDGARIVSPVGADGSFYFEDVPAGQHLAVVRYGAEPCAFTLDVPQSKGPIVVMGTVRCAAQSDLLAASRLPGIEWLMQPGGHPRPAAASRDVEPGTAGRPLHAGGARPAVEAPVEGSAMPARDHAAHRAPLPLHNRRAGESARGIAPNRAEPSELVAVRGPAFPTPDTTEVAPSGAQAGMTAGAPPAAGQGATSIPGWMVWLILLPLSGYLARRLAMERRNRQALARSVREALVRSTRASRRD